MENEIKSKWNFFIRKKGTAGLRDRVPASMTAVMNETGCRTHRHVVTLTTGLVLPHRLVPAALHFQSYFITNRLNLSHSSDVLYFVLF